MGLGLASWCGAKHLQQIKTHDSKKSVGKRICKRMNGELIENGALLHHIVEVLECPFYQGTDCRHERLAGVCQ